jgi:cytochrome P450
MTNSTAIEDLDGPPRLPFLGNALQIKPHDLHLTLERWCARYGPVFRVDLGPRRHVVIGDAELAGAIMRDRPDGFRRVREFGTILPGLGIDGVFNAEGEDWRRQRRLAVTALNAGHVERYYDVIYRAAQRLHERLRIAADAGGPVDIAEIFGAYTVEVTSELAFGVDLAGTAVQLEQHVGAMFAAAARRLAAPVPYWRYVRLPSDRSADRSVETLRTAVSEFISLARGRMQDDPSLYESPTNFLEGMISAQRDEGRYSDSEIAGNTMTMLLAGEDTTSHTLGWTSWFLARQPDVQARLARAARELLGSAAVPLDHETASGFAYGEAVLRDSLWRMPVVTLLFLEALRDTTVGALTLRAGTRVILLTRYASLVAAGIPAGPPWPMLLQPEAWLRQERESKDLLAFGAGPRFCPGRNLAFLEAQTALLVLATGFELALDPDSPAVQERASFTVIPHGLRVRVRERPTTAG